MQTDALVIGFAVVVACGSALVFGFAPALRSSRVDLVSVMKEDSPRGSARSGLRSGLVVAQVAVSLLLLVGAGLVTRSLDAAERADRGYSDAGVTAVHLDLKANGYDETRGRIFYRQLLDSVRSQPGVELATLATFAPMAFLETRSSKVTIDGYVLGRNEDLSMLTNAVGPDYFRTLRIPLVDGREFEARDDDSAAPVAVVNRTLAEKFWGSASAAIGRKVRLGAGDWRTVIGVAADIKYIRINEAPRPYIYVPFLQAYRSDVVLHTRGTAAVDVLLDRTRQAIVALDPELPVVSGRSLSQATRGALLFYSFMASMLFIFGAAGMALAALGTYGLVSYTVKQSTHEIGIRMALGASRSSVVRVFVGRGMRLGLIGVAVGTAGAFGVGKVIRSVLFGVSPTDLGSFARALAIVIGVVLVATLLPAWRASRTDPLKALRHQ
jgi:predicted permease